MAVEIAKPYMDPCAGDLLASMPPYRRALLLDRDGVINVDHGYVHKPEDTEWVAGIFDLCAMARHAGYLLVVITNQAGIARGYYGEEEFLVYTRWMHEQFALKGVPLTATYYCPHHPDAGRGALRTECACRKPKPGMILSAAFDLQLDLSACVLIGDKSSDLAAGTVAGLGKNILKKGAMLGPDILLRDLFSPSRVEAHNEGRGC